MNTMPKTNVAFPAGAIALVALLSFPAGRALADDTAKPPAAPPAAPMQPPPAPAAPASPAPQAGRFFDTYDANQDGKVSKEEFTGDPDTFALFDANHDGFITLEEMGLPADYKPHRLEQPKDEKGGGGKEGGRPGLGERFRKQFEEWDTNKDGKLSKEEYKGQIPFETLDIDKDGFVTREEMMQRLRQMAPGLGGGKGAMPTPEERMARFKEADKNGDGKITMDEWPGSPERFKQLDKNGDGAITPDEMEAAMKEPPPGLPGEGGKKKGAFGRFDKNGDGKVSRDEFPGSDETFKALDKNGDGFLSPDEMEGLKPKQFGKPGKGGKGTEPGKPDEPAPPAPGSMPGGEMPGAGAPPPAATAFTGLWTALDRNKDGKISRDEFPGTDLEWKKYDTNGDGWITPDEAAGK